jgi:hypothetical protein
MTYLYLELGLPLQAALQAAEADLWRLDVSKGLSAASAMCRVLISQIAISKLLTFPGGHRLAA